MHLFTFSAIVLVKNTIQVDISNTAVFGGVFNLRFFTSKSFVHIIQGFHHKPTMSHTKHFVHSRRTLKHIPYLFTKIR